MIYDVKTSNKSFLKMAKMLKDHGVKNNKFMLTLYDESLVGVDPWDPKLTQEQKISVYLETCRNYWYYIREVIRVPVAGANIQYNLHQGNLAVSYLRLKNKNLILEMPRQVGKTTATIIFDTWAFLFGTKNSRIVYMHKDTSQNGVLKNVKDFGEFIKSIPPYLKEMVSSKGDTDNVESKINVKNKNILTIIGNPVSHEEANKRGRGISTPLVFIDEFAFVKFFDKIYKALGPAWKQASEFAKKNNVPYGLILATTPGDPDSDVGRFALKMIENALKWDMNYYDLSDEELNEILAKNSTNDFFYLRFDYKQCGKDEKFIEEAIRMNNGDMLTVRREYLLEWLTNFENSIFTAEELEKVRSSLKPPVLNLRVNKYYKFEFYEEPNWKLNYIIGCDVSGGLSNDYSTMVICHPNDFHVVGIFHNNIISTDDFTELIIDVATIYFPNSLWVIERNSFGTNILDRLVKIPDIERRLFREYKERNIEKTIRDGVVVKDKVKQWIYGNYVSNDVRDMMMDLLSHWVANHPDKIVSEAIYKELAQMQKDKYGRIMAPEKTGYHDDLIFAMLHVLHACLQTKYMKELFGIRNVIGSQNAREDVAKFDINAVSRMIDNANLSAMLKHDDRIGEVYKPQFDDNIEKDQYDSIINILNAWNSH